MCSHDDISDVGYRELRPVEYQTLIALDHQQEQKQVRVTRPVAERRQCILVMVAGERFASGSKMVTMLATKLGVSKRTIHRDLVALEHSGLVGIVKELPYLIKPVKAGQQFTEKQIRAQMMSVSRECVTVGTPGCQGRSHGRYAFCSRCRRFYGPQCDWDAKTRKWLKPLVAMFWKQLRHQAIEELYESTDYGAYADLTDSSGGNYMHADWD